MSTRGSATLSGCAGRSRRQVADLFARRDDATVQAIERDLRAIVPASRRFGAVPADVERARSEVVRLDDQAHAFERIDVVPGYLIQVEMAGAGWLDADLLSEGTLITLALLAVLHGSSRPKLQIVATTHSPYLLDKLEPSEVRVMGLRQGRTVCKKLTDHPEWGKWKGSLRSGEFWGSVGEDWITA